MWMFYYIIAFTASWTVHGLMFPLVVSPESKACADNRDCPSGCCLKISMSYRKPIEAICQPKGSLGEFCAPGDRLRKWQGSQFYTYSCPCQPGLWCQPLVSYKTNGVNFIGDPKCTHNDIDVHSSLVSRFLYNSSPSIQAEPSTSD